MICPFDTPQKSINWAKQFIEKGEEATKLYFDQGPFMMIAEHNQATGEILKKFKLIREPSPEIEGFFTDAVVRIKHSFDQSLYAAAQAAHYFKFDKNYPWSDSYSGLISILKARQKNKNTKLSQKILDEIVRQKPYFLDKDNQSPDYLIREMARIANDKHTIGFTAAASVCSMRIQGLTMVGPAEFLYPWDPIKKEMVIYRTMLGGSVTHGKPTFSADIFFDRNGILRTVAAGVALQQFVDRAQYVLDGFKSLSEN